MAPEIALDKIELLTDVGDTVLDPMCGSGTVVKLAAEQGRVAIGTDVDPLAVMITRTATHGHWSEDLEERAKAVALRARRFGPSLPKWVADDQETSEFIDYWFAPDQAEDLSRLARALAELPLSDDPLRVALSRMIVTKEGGASLARDTAHSRPHRVEDDNDFNILDEYILSARKLANCVTEAQHRHRPSVRCVDARMLRFIPPGSVDLVATSPPYLNAIDYLRGHKMSLVWLGWTVGSLRKLRGEAVGAERGIGPATPPAITEMATGGVPRMADLPQRRQQMVLRFTQDIDRLASSVARVVRRKGHLVMVVADSQLGGVPISNSAICAAALASHGFKLIEKTLRPLPAQHRYLPPPATTTGMLAQRMREEVVFTFKRV